MNAVASSAGADDRVVAAARALLRQGQYASAARLLREVIAHGAAESSAWHYLGSAEYAQGHHRSAEAAFSRAIELVPTFVDALCGRATVRAALGDLANSERDLRSALAADQKHVQALCNLAIVRERQGDRVAALDLYAQVLALDGTNYTARLNRGALRLDAGDAEGALEDFDALVGAPQAGAIVHVNRARALFELYRDSEALEAADAALRLEPSNERALLDRGLALASLGMLEEAQAALARAPEAHDNPALRPGSIRMSRLIFRQSVCDWAGRSEAVASIRQALDDPARRSMLGEPGFVFPVLNFPLGAAELKVLASIAMESSVERGAHIASALAPLPPPSLRERIRVGFFAASLRLHPESYLLRRLFTDRDRSRFEYFLYALNADDRSRLRAEIAGSADRFVDVSTWSAEQIARLARGDGLDIAIDLSVGYVDAKPELFAARVAPVQASYLAVASTLSERLHDYRISDSCTTPASEQTHWWEKLVLLALPPWAYDNQLAAASPGSRHDHGLPEQGVVFTCMNQGFKLDPEAFDIWMRLMKRSPGSVLWLLDLGRVSNANLRREARSRGIAPERLVFAARAPLEAHLARLRHADIFLDTFYCNAHTTALDALWAGVPVLTLTGKTMASRLATSFVLAAGLPELATTSVAQYEESAQRWAADPHAREALKEKVREARSSPLFDTQARVRSVERAITAMVERHRSGLPSDTLLVE